MRACGLNHIATKSYLRAWTDPGGRLVQVPLSRDRGEKRLPPAVVGACSRFFRDRAVAEAAEKRIGRYEGAAMSVVRRLDDLWPLSDEDRFALAGLLAVHIYRSPSGHGRVSEITTAELARRESEYRATRSHIQVEAFYASARQERFEVQYILDSIPKTAALIASAHWPRGFWGAAAGHERPTDYEPPVTGRRHRPLPTLPMSGLLGTEEFRFALSPSKALVCTWMDRPDGEPAIRGDEEVAAQLNRTVIDGADAEWFYRPGWRSTTITAHDLRPSARRPVGRTLLPGYGTAHVRGSRRLTETIRNVETMNETDTGGRVVIAKVEHADGS